MQTWEKIVSVPAPGPRSTEDKDADTSLKTVFFLGESRLLLFPRYCSVQDALCESGGVGLGIGDVRCGMWDGGWKVGNCDVDDGIAGAIVAGMEQGFVLPPAGEDAEWMRENMHAFRAKADSGDEDMKGLVEEIERRKMV